jgi:hypothetical protein
MSAVSVSDRLQQQTEQLCRLLEAGDHDRATAQLPGMDSLLLEAVSRPLTELAGQIAQLQAGRDVSLQLAFRTLRLTAEHTLRLLQTIPALSVNGPHIRLHTDSIMARLTTLNELVGDAALLQAGLSPLLQGDVEQKIQAAGELQSGLNRLNSRLAGI